MAGAKSHYASSPRYRVPPPAVPYTAPVPVRRKPPGALSQFTQSYQCPRVRSLIADLNIDTLRILPTVDTAAPAVSGGAEGLVRTVTTLFRNLENVIFVVQDSSYTRRSLIRMMTDMKESLERGRERHANELERGHVQWKWPRVTLAIRVWREGWRLVELEEEVLIA